MRIKLLPIALMWFAGQQAAFADDHKRLLDWVSELRFPTDATIILADIETTRQELAPFQGAVEDQIWSTMPFETVDLSFIMDLRWAFMAPEMMQETVGFGPDDISLIAAGTDMAAPYGHFRIAGASSAIREAVFSRTGRTVSFEGREISMIAGEVGQLSYDPFINPYMPIYLEHLDEERLTVFKREEDIPAAFRDAPLLLDNPAYQAILTGIHDPAFIGDPVQIVLHPKRPLRGEGFQGFPSQGDSGAQWRQSIAEIGPLPAFEEFAYVEWRNGDRSQSGIVIPVQGDAELLAERLQMVFAVPGIFHNITPEEMFARGGG